MAKEYCVMKDGAELKTYKSLPAAKALAEKEGAEIFYEGECVFPVASDEPPIEEEKQPMIYRLLSRMNVRKEPSLKADKLVVLETGTEVDVLKVKDDWLCLADGSFILYGGGEYAEKI